MHPTLRTLLSSFLITSSWVLATYASLPFPNDKGNEDETKFIISSYYSLEPSIRLTNFDPSEYFTEAVSLSKSQLHFSNLPSAVEFSTEILYLIFIHLPTPDYFQLKPVCQIFYEIITNQNTLLGHLEIVGKNMDYISCITQIQDEFNILPPVANITKEEQDQHLTSFEKNHNSTLKLLMREVNAHKAAFIKKNAFFIDVNFGSRDGILKDFLNLRRLLEDMSGDTRQIKFKLHALAILPNLNLEKVKDYINTLFFKNRCDFPRINFNSFFIPLVPEDLGPTEDDPMEEGGNPQG